MDSITQIALGAAVGEVVLGRQVGRRAMLWGGICGLFPDLDLLVPLNDAVKELTYHRGPSHSLFVLAALASPHGATPEQMVRTGISSICNARAA